MAECPRCGDDHFESERGMKYHHATVHGESISKEEYECTWCEDTFERHPSTMTDSDNQFCSDDCMGSWIEHEQEPEDAPRWEGGEDPHECSWCGETFFRHSSNDTESENDFCSTECFGKWQLSRPKEEHPRWNGGDVETQCRQCGTEVTRRRSVFQKQESVFCSIECQALWRQENWTGESVPTHKSVTVICEVCDEQVERPPSRVERNEHHFCSDSCYSEWLSENNVGKNHPRWRGGYEPYYGPTWESQRRKAIERDGYQCRDCDTTRDEHYEIFGADLEVHHRTPLREFSDTSEANKLDNLVTLCTPCHMKRENSEGEQYARTRTGTAQ